MSDELLDEARAASMELADAVVCYRRAEADHPGEDPGGVYEARVLVPAWRRYRDAHRRAEAAIRECTPDADEEPDTIGTRLNRGVIGGDGFLYVVVEQDGLLGNGDNSFLRVRIDLIAGRHGA